MTTLHSLVTISELFAGFNLINTGIVNCLIVSECKKNQKISGSGHRPTCIGRGHPLSKPYPLGALILALSALDLAPMENPGSASGYMWELI